MNYHLGSVIGDNETGFNGIEDATYRTEAWDFIMAGGGLFNHLDYSFTTDNEDGTDIIEPGQPGGGGKTLRYQFRILAEFIKSFDYVNMTPLQGEKIRLPQETFTTVQSLAKEDDLLAVYLHRKDTVSAESAFEIDLRAGSYNLTWLDTKTAMETKATFKGHKGGWLKVNSPAYIEDIALRIEKKK
jgi:hypothetical protein